VENVGMEGPPVVTFNVPALPGCLYGRTGGCWGSTNIRADHRPSGLK